MHFLKHVDNNILKYDLINKFLFKNIKKLPKLQQIILSFSNKSNDINSLSKNAAALEIITQKKGSLIRTKMSKITLKIRKGDPVGYKIILRKSDMYQFTARLIIEIFPKLKDFIGLKTESVNKTNSFSLILKDVIIFPELQEYYYLFNNLTALNITFVTTASNKAEFLMLLKNIQLPFTSEKHL